MKLKRIGITAMAFFLAVGSVTPKIAFAMEGQREILTDENPQWISPLWISISDISPRISSSGITLYPEAYIEAKSSTGSISGTMYLEKYSSGSWKAVTSWSLKGTSYVSISKSYQGTLGKCWLTGRYYRESY